ncbi:MAG TPA: carbohydrate-binding family 9-like protein, partial [Haliangium sp.]|nr:carbohydrate-binding family 9-like protein [Haliangium sp.]
FATAEGSPEVQGATKGRLLWDDQHLYVFVTAQDKNVSGQYTNNDDAMWKEDVIELFIDADGNRRGYAELQVNPNNAQFDAFLMTTRAGPIDMGWSARMKSAVTVHGTLNQSGDEDTGWDVEIAIPLASVKGTNPNMPVLIPPELGNTWRLNVVRVDKPEADKNPVVSSWSQITYQDFHGLDRLLEVVFGDESGKTEAATPAATPGAAPAEGASGGAAPAEGSAPQTPAPGSAAKAPGKDKAAAQPATPAPTKPAE